MTDRHQPGLSEALHGAVPEPPTTPDRASAALGIARRRRRHRTGAVAVAAAVAVATVTLGVAGLGSTTPLTDPATTASPTITPTETVTVVDPVCPAPMRRGDAYVDRSDARPLPTGAVAARLCPTSVGDFGGFAPPSDALTTDVDAVVAEISDLPRYRNTACTAEGALSYWLVLAYPDGTERVVEGSLAGCEILEGAGPRRTGAEGVWNTYLGLLREQRASGTPPGSVGIGCPVDETPTSPLATSLDLEHAVLQWRRTDVESESPWVCAPIPDADLRTILDDLAAGPDVQLTEEQCREATLQLTIVGVSAWGDVGRTSGDCGAWSVDDVTWRRLGPEGQSVVDRIVAGGGAPPLPEATPEMTPDEVFTLFADLVNDGRLDEARELTTDASLAEVDGRLDVKVEDITDYATRGIGTVDVTALYRVVPPGASLYVDYREATVRMTRTFGSVWQIDAITLGDVVPTGR